MRDSLRLDQVTPKAPPPCPTCGREMLNYGGTAGFIHCGWKLLYRAGGWFDEDGLHVSDPRLAGPFQDQGTRDVSGEIHERIA